ncbi:MAG: methyltransferase domain-containing protein [Bacteroidetes bacterium]|nr:methyltransferase domain-containing protein [Bacteroidota bacterium]
MKIARQIGLTISLFMVLTMNLNSQNTEYLTPQELITTAYTLMSFDGGNPPDWEKIKNLFHPQANIILRTSPTEMTLVDRDGFVALWLKDMEEQNLKETGIKEEKIIDSYEIMGDIATCYVIYAVTIPTLNYPPQLGIDCFHLIKQNGRWYIISIVNEALRPGVDPPQNMKDEFAKYFNNISNDTRNRNPDQHLNILVNNQKKPSITKDFYLQSRAERDSLERPNIIMNLLEIKPGMFIGEAGAGEGYFTFHLSERIGLNGIIYANDISEENLNILTKYSKDFQKELNILDNIITVKGTEIDPCFPKKELDLIVIYHGFHEFEKKNEWLKNAYKYLKKGGKIAFVDSYHSNSGLTRDIINQCAIDASFSFLLYQKPSWNVLVYIKD